MKRKTPVVTASTLISSWPTQDHDDAWICPGDDCGLDVTTVGIISLAYTFRVCRCTAFGYPHLVEQLWHRDCLIDSTEVT